MKTYPRATMLLRGFGWLTLVAGFLLAFISLNAAGVADRWLFGLISVIGGLIGFAFMHGFAILIESNIDTRDSLYEVKTEVMRLKNGKA